MNITQAIKEVSKRHAMPVKNGVHGWLLYHPLDIMKMADTTQSSICGSYQNALEARRGYIAYDVVILCNASHDKAVNAMYDVTENEYSIIDAVKRNIS